MASGKTAPRALVRASDRTDVLADDRPDVRQSGKADVRADDRDDVRQVIARGLLCLALVCLTVACFQGCCQPAWKEFDCKEGGYRLRAPEIPRLSQETAMTAIGPVTVNFHNLLYRHVQFISCYADYPESYVKGTTVSAILSGARDGGLAKVEGELISEKKIELAGYPGRGVVIRSPADKRIIRSNIFIAGRRFYQAMVIVPDTGKYDEDAKRFLAGFEIYQRHERLVGTDQPWGEFQSPEGRFTILAAGRPEKKTEALSTEKGFIELHSFPFEDDGFSYVVSYADYPAERVAKLGAASIFTQVQTNMAGKAKGRVEEVKELTVQNQPARSLSIQPQDQRYRMRCRLILAKHRLYQLVVVYPSHAPDKTNVDVFLKSFRMVLGK